MIGPDSSGQRTIAVLAAMVAVLVCTVVQAAAAPDLPAEPSGLSAFTLLDNAGYQAALGEAVTGPEDDGGLPLDNGTVQSHDSVTRVQGASGLLYTVELLSLLDATAAGTYYDQQAARSTPDSEPIDGAGDRAFYFAQAALVLSGAQVLNVQVEITGAAEQQLEQAKEQGQDNVALATTMSRSVIPLAQALAPHLTGQAATEPSVGLPVGAIDPCDQQLTLFQDQLGLQVFGVAIVRSERPPALECQISTSQFSASMYIASEAQLLGGIQPQTVDQQYAADLAAVAADSPTEVATGVRAYKVSAPEIGAEMVVLDTTGRPVLLRAEIPGSPPVPGQEAAQADLLLQALQLRGAAITSGVPLTPPTTEPPATSTTSTALVTAAPPTAETSVTQPSNGAATPVATATDSDSGSGGSSGLIVVLVLVVLAGAAAVVVVTARRRRRIVPPSRPQVRGVAGTAHQHITLHAPAVTIGIRPVVGPERQTIRKENDSI